MSKADILIVDDINAHLKILDLMLRSAGYQVEVAESGDIALATARSAPPDLILLDVQMPMMNGYEVCEQIKADPSLKDVPVIFITAIGDGLDKDRAVKVGAADFISKPFRMDEILEKVEYHLTHH